jgi:hypothetical protein
MKSLFVKRRFILIIIGVAIFNYGTLLGQEKYLCVAELATGFAYNENSKSWVIGNFKADSKYIISKSDNKEYKFKVTKVGENYPTFECKEGGNEYGYLHCQGIGQFSFNKNNGRYLMTFPIGYFNVIPERRKSFGDKSKTPFTDKDSETPYMEIGKCSPF